MRRWGSEGGREEGRDVRKGKWKNKLTINVPGLSSLPPSLPPSLLTCRRALSNFSFSKSKEKRASVLGSSSWLWSDSIKGWARALREGGREIGREGGREGGLSTEGDESVCVKFVFLIVERFHGGVGEGLEGGREGGRKGRREEGLIREGEEGVGVRLVFLVVKRLHEGVGEGLRREGGRKGEVWINMGISPSHHNPSLPPSLPPYLFHRQSVPWVKLQHSS